MTLSRRRFARTRSVLETKLQANLELANNLAGPRIILNFSNHFAVESILRPSQPMRSPTYWMGTLSLIPLWEKGSFK